MPKVCDVKEVPVGGIYRDFDPQKQETRGPELIVLSKGTVNGIGFNVIQRRLDGTEIRDMHFSMRNPVLWINDAPLGEAISAANLLMQAVVLPGARIESGRIIEAVAIPWFEIIKLLKADPKAAYQIAPRKWEEIIAGAYKRAGFEEVILTPSSGDYGRDIIAVKHGICSVRIIDQVKAYKPGHFVTANDVRALLGVVEADKASKGCLTTTSDFAPRLAEDILLKPYMPARIELVNGVQLLDRLDKLASQ